MVDVEAVAKQPHLFVGILMQGSINASELSNMAILNPNIATSVTTAKTLGIMTQSAVTSHTGSAAVQTGSNTTHAPGFITTTLRHVTPTAQASVAQNSVTVQSQPTIQVLGLFICPSFIDTPVWVC